MLRLPIEYLKKLIPRLCHKFMHNYNGDDSKGFICLHRYIFFIYAASYNST